jgi:hypothetical protein
MDQQKVMFASLQTSLQSSFSAISRRFDALEQSNSPSKNGEASKSPSYFSAACDSAMKSEGHSADSKQFGVDSAELHTLLDNSPPLRRELVKRSDASQVILKDPAIKLVPPKVTCKDPLKIRPKEFMTYFEEVDAFIGIWESQPGNANKIFDGAESFALKNLKIAEQKQLAKLISVIFDRSELRFVKKSEYADQIFWLSVTTQMAKAKLSAKMSNETSLQACMRDLKRVKFVSPFGLIDPDAWDDYKKKILDLLALQDTNGFEIPDCIIKDSIILALPDFKYQQDLILLFGPIGSMYGHQDLAALIKTIEARIQSIMSQNLQAVVNQAVAHRDSQGKKFKANVSEQLMELRDGISDDETIETPDQFDCHEGEEIDDQMQLMAYLAAHNKEQCKRAGVGPDGKLKCKFLGGPKAQCIFVHSEDDMKLKGRGFTFSTPAHDSVKTDPRFSKQP